MGHNEIFTSPMPSSLLKSLISVSLCLTACLAAFPLFAAESAERGSSSGTYRGRVISERFLHRQAETRGGTVAALLAEPLPLRQNQGDIAVIDTRNGVVTTPNFLDLQGRTLRFSPVGGGFSGVAEPQQLDEQARELGLSLALADDDGQRVELPFDFPYFGKVYRDLFVNSDGNLTFGEPDADTASRSFARAAAGPPRIAPMFVDLDPSRTGARVRAFVSGERAVFTWDGVPQFSRAGTGRRQIFQVELRPDGAIAFHYLTANLNVMVAGLFPGNLAGELTPADLSEGFPATAGGVAELFQLVPNTDPLAAAQQFYGSHDDTYDFIILFNNLSLGSGPGAFAFEINIRNEILGIGDLLSPSPVFDFGDDFGSPRRLASFINMGPLSQYPVDPLSQVPLIGENTTVSVLGQEVGHRWLTYVDFIDPETGLRSSDLLGRQRAHWSFFYNSNASVLEGNRIEDKGEGVSPRFETAETVARFSELDQYLMGLRAPEDTPASFLVRQPTGAGGSAAGRPPRTGVTFDGRRQEIPLDLIVAAEGPRIPGHTVAEKEFRFAFILLVDEDVSEVPAADLDKINLIRTAWQAFFAAAVEGRAEASTALVRMLHLSAWPAAGVLSGGTGAGRVEIAEPLQADLTVNLASDSGAAGVPATVAIPAGETAAEFPIAGNAAGVARLTAMAAQPGFDRAAARIEVSDRPAALTLEIVSGDAQAGAVDAPLPAPMVVQVRDANRLTYSGVELAVEVTDGGGSTTAPRVMTGADGRASIEWRLGPTPTLGLLRVSLVAAPAIAVTATATASGGQPVFLAEGVVSAASFNAAGTSAGVAPGSLASIFGVNLATGVESARSFPLPRELGGARIRINGTEVPLLAATPGQINFQLPFELFPGPATLSIATPTGESAAVTIPIAALDPGIFADSATGFGAIRFPSDGGIAATRAARPGETVEIFATGLGAVDPRTETGEAASGFLLSLTREEVTVLIGERRLPALFSGLAPLFAGLYQVNVTIPDNLPPGRYEVRLEIGGRLSDAVLLDIAE